MPRCRGKVGLPFKKRGGACIIEHYPKSEVTQVVVPLGAVSALVGRFLIAAFIWWVLTEGRPDSWLVGSIVVAATVVISLRLIPPASPSPGRVRAVFGFAGFFLLQSLHAGFQVASLALVPKSRLQPGTVELSLTLPPGAPRYLLAATLSLLPGTLSVQLADERLVVHALTDVDRAEASVRNIEARIAPMFGGSVC